MNMHNPRLPAGHREYGRKDAGGGNDPGVAQIQGEMSRILNEVKGFAEKAGAEVKANGDLTKATKEKVDEALLKLGETTTRLQEAHDRLGDVEQKLARRGNPDAAPTERTLGQAVIESESFKSGGMTSASRMSLRVKMDRKDITSANGTVGAGRSPGNSLVPADRQRPSSSASEISSTRSGRASSRRVVQPGRCFPRAAAPTTPRPGPHQRPAAGPPSTCRPSPRQALGQSRLTRSW